jgi:hypothetical protein
MQTTTLSSALPSNVQAHDPVMGNMKLSIVADTPNMIDIFKFPKSFILPDHMSSIASVFEYKTSSHQQAGEQAGREWIHSFV